MTDSKRNLTNYVASLLVLIALALVYSVVSNHLLRTPDVTIVTPRPPTAKIELKSSLADLFPANAWQRGDCKRLLTSNGALLFQNWRQTAEDQWTLQPVTIISGRGLAKEGDESPVILTATDGAQVSFARSLDVMDGSAPPIKMGRMIGDVLIERANVDQSSQAMSVRTRNVRIDNEKIWTTEAIEMKIGGAIMRGRDLTIHLAASAASAANSSAPSSVLDRMELVYLDDLRIPLDGKIAGKKEKGPLRRIGSASKSADTEPALPSHVTIHCKGAMNYDFALDRLSLRDEILMQRWVGDEVFDHFDCETLDLVLRNPSDQKLDRDGPLDWIENINATGTPANLRLKTQAFELSAESINFDAFGGLLSAKGTTGVQLRRGDIQARLAELTYQYDPEFPEEIGFIDANGFGIITLSNPKLAVRQIKWSNGFKIQSLGKTTIDGIREKKAASKLGFRIYGDIVAKLADGTFQAGEIEGQLRPYWYDAPNDEKANTQPSGAVITAPVEKRERKLTFVPEFLRARDAVALVSSAAEAKTDDLVLYFETAVDWMTGKKTTAKSKSDQPSIESVIQPATQPSIKAPVARSRPRLEGGVIMAKLLLSPDGLKAKDLSIRQDVKVTHEVVVGDRMMPIELTGDTMRLQQDTQGQGEGHDYLQLGSGPDSPARLKLEDGFFVGPMIKVWPTDNVIQVDGNGELQVPRSLMPADASQLAGEASSAGNIRWQQAPYCRWNGGLHFNGKNVVLSGGVSIEAKFESGGSPWDASINGDQMAIELSEAIELSKPSSFRTSTIKSVQLAQLGDNAVTVAAEQRNGDGSIQGRHMLTANRLTFLPADGGTIWGSGPGWYRGWVINERSNSLLSKDAQPDRDARLPVLQGVHLTFREQLRGDLLNQTLAFTGGVRSATRPLDNWDETVQVEMMDRLANDEMTMDCAELKFGVSPHASDALRDLPGMPTPWEMSASGGVVFRSQTQRGLVQGQADRASFESKKSNLVIYGAPNQAAVISVQTPNAPRPQITRIPKMSLNLKTYEIEGQLQGAQLSNVPTQ